MPENWEASFSSGNDNWGTPPELMASLVKMGITFDIDVASTRTMAKAPIYLGPDHENPTMRDALSIDWRGVAADRIGKRFPATLRAWLNAPYSEIGKFTEKAFNESRIGSSERDAPLLEVWSLCFVRSDTAWWQKFCACSAEITFIAGRLPFIDPATSLPRRNVKTGHIQCAPAPSALLVFRPGYQGPPAVFHRDLMGRRTRAIR